MKTKFTVSVPNDVSWYWILPSTVHHADEMILTENHSLGPSLRRLLPLGFVVRTWGDNNPSKPTVFRSRIAVVLDVHV